MPYYCFFCPAILLWIMISEGRRKKYELSSIIRAKPTEALEVMHFIGKKIGSSWKPKHERISEPLLHHTTAVEQ